MSLVRIRFLVAGSWMDKPQDPIFHVREGDIKHVSQDLAYIICQCGKGELVDTTPKAGVGPEEKKVITAADLTLGNLGLKPAVLKKLKEANINTVTHLTELNRKDLLEVDGLGVGKVDDIEAALKKKELSLKEG